jgi:hypothetical protein
VGNKILQYIPILCILGIAATFAWEYAPQIMEMIETVREGLR